MTTWVKETGDTANATAAGTAIVGSASDSFVQAVAGDEISLGSTDALAGAAQGYTIVAKADDQNLTVWPPIRAGDAGTTQKFVIKKYSESRLDPSLTLDRLEEYLDRFGALFSVTTDDNILTLDKSASNKQAQVAFKSNATNVARLGLLGTDEFKIQKWASSSWNDVFRTNGLVLEFPNAAGMLIAGLLSVNLTGVALTPFVTSVAHFVNASGNGTFLTIEAYVGGASLVEPATYGRSARGTPSSPSAVQAHDYLYTWCAGGYTGAGGWTANSRARMTAMASENWTTTATGTRFEWSVTQSTTTLRVNRMTLTDGGSLLLGTDLVVPLSGERLQIRGDGTWNASNQVMLVGATNPNKKLLLAIDTTNNVGAIDAILDGTGGIPLALNVFGGKVGIGTLAPVEHLQINKNTTSIAEGEFGIAILAAAGNTKLVLGASTAGAASYVQSFQATTSWAGRPLHLQPNGGYVIIGGGTTNGLVQILAPSSNVGFYCRPQSGAIWMDFQSQGAVDNISYARFGNTAGTTLGYIGLDGGGILGGSGVATKFGIRAESNLILIGGGGAHIVEVTATTLNVPGGIAVAQGVQAGPWSGSSVFSGGATVQSVPPIKIVANGASLRWGHNNPAYYNELGNSSATGIPYVAFFAAHSTTANAMKNSGTGFNGMYLAYDGTTFSANRNGVATADADFSATVTLFSATAQAFQAPILNAVSNGGANYIGNFINQTGAAGTAGISIRVGPEGADSASQIIGFLTASGNIVCGSVTRTGTNQVSYNTSSDIRGKPNRERLDLEQARRIVDSLVMWDFDKPGNRIRGVGVIAQEAYEIHRSLATPGLTPEEDWGAEKAGPMPFVVANLQQANRRIDELEKKIAELEAA